MSPRRRFALLVLLVPLASLAAPAHGWSSEQPADQAAPDAHGPGDLARWIGGHPMVTLRLNDIPRSRQRFAQSPYADLLSTTWGHELVDTMSSRLAVGDLTAATVTQGLQAIALGVDGGPAAPGVSWVASSRDADALCHWYEQAIAPNSLLQIHGSVITCGSLCRSQPGNPSATPNARYPQACLELRLDPGRALSALGLPGLFPDLDQASPHPLAVAASLDAIGMREHWDIAIKQRARWNALTLPCAHVDLLRSLPGDTVMACTFNCDANAMMAGLLASGVSQRPVLMLAADVFLARLGLPPLVEFLRGMHGDCVAWVSAGTAEPSWTVVAGMDPGLAIPLQSMLVNQLGLTPGPAGVYVGFLAGSPFQISFQNGRLLATTQACGVEGCLDQPAGFASHDDVQAALRELPGHAVLLGVSRSGCAMELLGRLGLGALAHQGLPELSTLPHDLASRARHGFISIQQTASGLGLDAGGMLGGPLITYATVGSAAFASYLSMMREAAAVRSALPPPPTLPLDCQREQRSAKSL